MSACDPRDEHSDVNESTTDLPSTNSNEIQPVASENTMLSDLDVLFTATPCDVFGNDMYTCGQCKKILPEDGGSILEDNSNASVGCDCQNCGGCNAWFCWPCARYTEEWVEENIDWFCPMCTRDCDIVY